MLAACWSPLSWCAWRIPARTSTRTKLHSSAVPDVATLGNLCVDIVLSVPALPPESATAKLEYMKRLESRPPPEACWEAGGICNFSIAAARLGLQCVSTGHVGSDRYGDFLGDVLANEGVDMVKLSEPEAVAGDHYDGSTLVCWVLVDAHQGHAFCSRFDFSRRPVLSRIRDLPRKAEAVIRESKALLLNGFVFDELAASVVLSAVECAHEHGGAVFFDPGPRGAALFAQNRASLEHLLRQSEVLLLTADEATALTGIDDPELSARALLDGGQRTQRVIVKLGGDGSLMAVAGGRVHRVPGYQVNVIDTVGCGDSFAAAAVMGYIHDLPPSTTLALANAVGAATATGCGAGRNVASLAGVLAVLSSRPDDAASNDARGTLLRRLSNKVQPNV